MNILINNKYIKRAGALALLLLTGCLWQSLQAQELYTLTNGTVWWFNGNEDDPDNTKYPRAMENVYNSTTGKWEWVDVYKTGGMQVTEITEMGKYYLALDTTGGTAQITAIPTNRENFSPLCLWTRTGNTGYYYQEIGSDRYYLVGNSTQGLFVVKIPIGDPIDRANLWYNWDFGAAETEVTETTGGNIENYYWITYDTSSINPSSPSWSMSGNSYERPETRIVTRRVEGGVEVVDTDFYFSYTDASGFKHPRGNGALFLPVEYNYHTASIASATTGEGLQGISFVNDVDATHTADTTLLLGQSATIRPIIGSLSATINPSYVEYTEETYRRGIHLKYYLRTDPTFNSAGIPTTRKHYYWDASPNTLRTMPPSPVTGATLTVIDTVYEIDTRSTRHARIEEKDGHATLYYNSITDHDMTIKVVVTVSYNYDYLFIDQSDTLEVTLSGYTEHTDRVAEEAPVIYGYVVGGGRMAKIGGNTNITVHSADSIYAVYGGNDIAGWVQGDIGATIQIGTTATSDSTPVRIGYMYGGGCGFYAYEDAYDASTQQWEGNGHLTSNLNYGEYAFRGNVYPWRTTDADLTGPNPVQPVATGFDYIPYVGPDFAHGETGDGGNGAIPYVKTAHITVGIDGHAGNDYIKIDSIFGGAENAFIGIDASATHQPEQAVTMDIHGGTIYALFGGNNYGGSVAHNAEVHVNVHNTKLTLEDSIENNVISGYGRDFGIRHLFGGGNLVEGSHAQVNITGGMIDTCFLGGNRASVKAPIGTVNCVGSNFIFDNPAIDTSDNGIHHSPANWSNGVGRYNIRCLFGGNNLASMDSLSTLNLLSGGLGHVYGGGNAGDMNYIKPLPPDLAATVPIAFNGWEFDTPTSLGSMIHAPKNSKIIAENIYGGCRMANVKGSTGLWLQGGTFGYVQGGNDISGDVGSETGGGTWVVVDTGAVVMMDVYGGSDGYYQCHRDGRYILGEDLLDYNDNPYDPYDEYVGMLVPTHNRTNLYIHGGTVLYSAYGGGVMSNVGFTSNTGNYIKRNGVEEPLNVLAGEKKGSVHFIINGGIIGSLEHHGEGYGDGNVYGGGYLSDIYGLSYFVVKGTSRILGSLFAGNDCMGSVQNFGSYTQYGEETPSAYMAFTASDGTPLNQQDERGNWGTNYSTYVNIKDSVSINSVYGGGNGAYDYKGDRPWYSSLEPVCQDNNVDNRPLQASTFIDLHTSALHPSGGGIDSVFGGGNGVGVRDNVTVLLNCENNDGRYVGTIFGGNNSDNMELCVPNIVLKRGHVKNVYGGSNSGNMNFKKPFTDFCGNEVAEVSTYVQVVSPDVTIDDSLFGGCRAADVAGMAYIDIRNTSPQGINYVYGGNNISGSVFGNTRIDVSGGTVHHIYGGSNGRYEYQQIAHDDYTVFRYGSTDAYRRANPHVNDTVATKTSGSPTVDSTIVNVFGGTITQDLFGGGSLGDCRATNVVINDRACFKPKANPSDPDEYPSAIILGDIYGGGEGSWLHLRDKHRGNITDATHVNLHHADSLATARAYGGGKGGDVLNTYITAYDTWDKPFDELYGGCWGSDVKGYTHVLMNGSDLGDYNVHNLFGGNDFTGNVYKSLVTINSGLFDNIYGAGNGNYDLYDTGTYAGYPVPNNEYVELTFNDGTVDGNLYGGGKLGTVYTFQKDDLGRYIIDNSQGYEAKIPDTSLTKATAHKNPADYSHIIVNVHGGFFNNNIYTGGAGTTGGNWIVYGLKELNMDGGNVYESVYGGSENVNDGYPHECDSTGAYNRTFTNTTARPSSILNLTGGIIQNNVYGGGYLGNVFGSVYVNVGQNAVNLCPVWTRHYVPGDSTYIRFKPGAQNGFVPSLATNQLLLESSLYGGANWAENTGSADFASAGFFGGESRILLDGLGYNTYVTPEQENLPQLNIKHSIIGSGTSADGGDMYNRIDIRNYGALKTSECKPSRTLRAIQRTDALWLCNTAIDYTGSTDAISAYISQQYTLNRIDTLSCIGYNVIDIDATASNIGEVNFYKHRNWGTVGTQDPYQGRELVQNTDPNLPTCAGDSCSACSSEPSVCEQLKYLDRPEENPAKSYTAVVMNNGINIDFISERGDYSNIYGYGYIIAEPQTNAIITANAKYRYNDYYGVYTDPARLSGDEEFGGFFSICSDSLKAIRSVAGDSNEVLTWCNCVYDNYGSAVAYDEDGNELDTNFCVDDYYRSIGEYPYFNYGTEYRVWSIGNGVRNRYAVIQAHANPSRLDNNTSVHLALNGDYKDLCIAKSTLELPPTTPGHYYKIKTTSGIIISDDNGDMKLVERGWKPVSMDNPSSGEWVEVKNTATCEDNISLDIDAVSENPGKYFGLVIASGPNFVQGTAGMPSGYSAAAPGQDPDCGWTGYTIVPGNDHVTSITHFTTAKVADAEHTKPTLDLYLTYDSNFSQTMLGTVEFTLQEFDAQGNDMHADIKVQITISTILEDFNDMEEQVLAMYNEGVTNTFTRKAVFPATLQLRELYLQGILWEPVKSDGGDYVSGDAYTDNFQLVNSEARVVEAPDTKTFSLAVQPVENVSNTLVTSVGWHRINQKTPLNLFSTVARGRNPLRVSAGRWDPARGIYQADTVMLTNSNNPKGLKLGELDGRGEAAMNIIFNFDGNKVYPATPDKGFVGKAVLKLASYKGNQLIGDPFYLTVDVKTRAHGDTIYIASAPTVTHPDGSTTYTGITEINNGNRTTAGKRPSQYVTNFRLAFHPDVYQEGDVIAVIGTVKVKDGEQLLIKGYDNVPVPVIRYFGHHRDLPGEAGVFRGTMIDVSGYSSSFMARNINFDGSLTGKVQKTWTTNPNPSVYKPLYYQGVSVGTHFTDTNKVFGPIIAVRDSGEVALQNGVTVANNYNGNHSDDAKLRGAISVTSKGTLSLLNNVTIKNNLTDSLPDDTPVHPLNGAVYVNNGTVMLNNSNASTAVTITDNYLKPTNQLYWKDYTDANGYLTRFEFDTLSSKTDSYTKANVFLTRLPWANAQRDRDLKDSVSDMIAFLDNVTLNTRIGVSKWFPGETSRDTIGIVYQLAATHLNEVENNGNFISDDGYYTFYNYGVNNQRIYLQRCATFKQQVAGHNPSLPGTGVYTAGDLLDYKPLLGATCPTGGDTLIYRLQGGFLPYTYTWNGNSSKTKSTPYTNSDVMKRVAQGDMDYYVQSVTDTLLTPYVNIPHDQSEDYLFYTVEANDVTGHCPLTKNISVRLRKRTDNVDVDSLFRRTSTAWVVPTSYGEVGATATGVRDFKAIKVTPMVWADRSQGTIVAQIVGDPKDSIYTETDGQPVLNNLSFCEGDIIRLHTAPRRDANGVPVSEFIMWDFDPFYGNPANYVVPAQNDTVVAYYGPRSYWNDTVRRMVDAGGVYDNNYTYTSRPTVAGYTSTDGSHKAGYVTTYNGDVHIYDERGLAWFISVVNGLNGTQARPFYYNRVFLHKKQDNTDYDMKGYLWTPVGSSQGHFRGHLFGVGSADTTTVPLTTGRVRVKNVIVNEPYAYAAGFFSQLDAATVKGIELRNALVRGSQYVGTLAARSTNTKVDNCAINNMAEGDASTTILTTRHTSGGMIGYSLGDSITNSEVNAKYVGDAVYSGGLLGYAKNSQVINNVGRNDNHMEGLYVGGIVGYLEDSLSHRTKSSNGKPALVANNYVQLLTDGNAQRVGGIVGYASGSIIENNYVYGTLMGSATEGGVGAVLDAGSISNHNYYEQSAVNRTAGQMRGDAVAEDNSDFSGSGNQVHLGTPVYGIDNLTRALNLWVRENGTQYRTWRSDLDNRNSGYPVFGTPDMIPVRGVTTLDVCDSALLDGQVYTFDTTFEYRIIDSVQMIDSTSLLTLLIHHSTSSQYYDSATLGEAYSGHGFEITAAETELLREAVMAYGSATLIVSDTLTMASGCDSIVSLYLTLTAAHDTTTTIPAGIIRVYPNPTVESVTVETQGLSHVEFFDNTGRHLQDYYTSDTSRLTIDVSLYSTGVYYLRIHNNEGVTIQKLIKQ